MKARWSMHNEEQTALISSIIFTSNEPIGQDHGFYIDSLWMDPSIRTLRCSATQASLLLLLLLVENLLKKY